MWDTFSGAMLRCLSGHSGGVCSVAFSPDDSKVVYGSDDTIVRVWDVSSGALLKSLEANCAQVYSAWFSPDGSKVVCGSLDKTILVWDISSEIMDLGNENVECLDGHLLGFRMVSFGSDGSDGSKLICDPRHKSECVGVWNASLRAVLRTLWGQLQHFGLINSVSVSAEGCQVICGAICDQARRRASGKSGCVRR